MVITHQQETIAEKRWWIKILAGTLGVVMLFVLGIVTYDILNGDIGWARYAEAYSNGEGAHAVLSAITDFLGL